MRTFTNENWSKHEKFLMEMKKVATKETKDRLNWALGVFLDRLSRLYPREYLSFFLSFISSSEDESVLSLFIPRTFSFSFNSPSLFSWTFCNSSSLTNNCKVTNSFYFEIFYLKTYLIFSKLRSAWPKAAIQFFLFFLMASCRDVKILLLLEICNKWK